ncbi:n-acetylmuramoyl-l-alanine amidase [Lucifera butyrica]|uniref:N-acetylmuramoyl-l-alanine amidase n=1 Tax=Lucifera butyrica TaxID=1351585 RepID=A0A498R051_9FIRM|nr:N-acetylmuramoyl-L-alanine amidase [Lucifera butyrica]VBB04874.1 n-acetylmuramoyl-l-alanine amidase [Lucifera butyrica]
MLMILRQQQVRRLAVFSIATVILNLAAIRYLVRDDLETVNLAALKGHKIIIDAGHGGIDSGASQNGVVEKDVNLAIARKLGRVLEDNGSGVSFTREDDIDYYTRGKGGKRSDLMKRVEMINAAGAEVFVSIHVNAIRQTELKGAQVFYNPQKASSKVLAETMQRALKDFPPGNKRQAKQDLGILLLNATTIPGVLVETGYVTNKEEAVRLADPVYQQKLAEQIARALAYHFSQNAGR